MKLSSRSQYAITAMLELAMHDNQSPVTLFDISSKQKVSLSYLEQLFANLRKHKLVRGRRGPGGGYVLARDPDDIAIADIIEAVDSDKAVTNEQAEPEGLSSEKLWNDLSAQIFDYLRSIKLSQFVHGHTTDQPGQGDDTSSDWKPEVSHHSRA